METNTNHTRTGADIADLGLISEACRELVDWYDRQLAGDTPTVTDLEPAMARLQGLPAMPGRLGEDINLVASGGASHSPGEVVGAIERLRLVANHNPDPPNPQGQNQQTQLPGFDPSEGGN